MARAEDFFAASLALWEHKLSLETNQDKETIYSLAKNPKHNYLDELL